MAGWSSEKSVRLGGWVGSESALKVIAVDDPE